MQSDMFFQDHQLLYFVLSKEWWKSHHSNLWKETIIEQYFILSILYFIQITLADDTNNPFQV